MQTEYDEKYNAYYKRELSGVALYDWEKLTDARRKSNNSELVDLAVLYIAFCKE